MFSDAESALMARLSFLANIAESNPLSESDRASLERLIATAQSDDGQASQVADFLLAWWNARTCRAFDLTHLWALDEKTAEDVFVIVRFIARAQDCYPDMLGYESEFLKLVAKWRPDLNDAG